MEYLKSVPGTLVSKTHKTITFQYSTSSNEAHGHKYGYQIRYVFDAVIIDMSIIENI
jgi:hypothetical protein